MARARIVKPSFFKNEVLAQCKHQTRLVFVGLWTLADRAGRLEDRPLRIRAELFPYENIDMDDCLDELVEHGFIVRYSTGLDKDSKYIQVLNFEKHQSPHVKESASTIPAPDKHQTSIEQAPLVTLTLNPSILTNGQSASPPDRFYDFWKALPTSKRVKRKDAMRIWKSKRLDDKADQIIADIGMRLSSDPRWKAGYIPDPTTYLNGERWTDEVTRQKSEPSRTVKDFPA
jgi:hypothetical protein